MINRKFLRKFRLLTYKDFSFISKNPKITNLSKIIILSNLNMLQYPRVGFLISKKNIKLAHERNRIKRVIRESFRLHKHILPALDFVFLAKKSIINISNKDLLQSLNEVWRIYYY